MMNLERLLKREQYLFKIKALSLWVGRQSTIKMKHSKSLPSLHNVHVTEKKTIAENKIATEKKPSEEKKSGEIRKSADAKKTPETGKLAHVKKGTETGKAAGSGKPAESKKVDIKQPSKQKAAVRKGR